MTDGAPVEPLGQTWTHLRSEAMNLTTMDDFATAETLPSWPLEYSDLLLCVAKRLRSGKPKTNV